jgi:NAD(P)-dependent dehydrogenase (short-subunit alcohol dehydrogenase family)
MRGRICLVTGATSGVGRAAAIALARMGAHVVIVARDTGRGAAALGDVRTASPTGAGELLLADLSSQAAIRRLAGEVEARLSALHVLVNNAGGIWYHRETTADGLERTVATNHLAYFLLTNLLLDRLRASAPARVVNVSSDAHYGAALDFDDLQGEQRYDGWAAYKRSKLANVLFTSELAARLAGSGVTANALHPGVVNTGISRKGSPLFRLGFSIARPFMLTPERGADTIVYLASAPEVSGTTGEYFEKRRAKTPSAEARDPRTRQRLWDVSEALVGLAAR